MIPNNPATETTKRPTHSIHHSRPNNRQGEKALVYFWHYLKCHVITYLPRHETAARKSLLRRSPAGKRGRNSTRPFFNSILFYSYSNRKQKGKLWREKSGFFSPCWLKLGSTEECLWIVVHIVRFEFCWSELMIELGGPKRVFQLQQSLFPHLPPAKFLMRCASLSTSQKTSRSSSGLKSGRKKSRSSSKWRFSMTFHPRFSHCIKKIKVKLLAYANRQKKFAFSSLIVLDFCVPKEAVL